MNNSGVLPNETGRRMLLAQSIALHIARQSIWRIASIPGAEAIFACQAQTARARVDGSRSLAIWHSVRLALTLVLIGQLCVAAAGADVGGTSVTTPDLAAQTLTFVGSQSCARCHAAEHARWSGSQHAAAMSEATDVTVLGQFDGRSLEHHGVNSRFFKRDGKFWVETDGPDGVLGEFEIRYTFGVAPLQQYLIELQGGRLQALGIAWDTRSAGEGGQRWFHLYPDRALSHLDALHWTGIDQNWNYQCAYCHSTDLKKGFNAETEEFQTRWSEINVGCEACHGPGSAHVDWAASGKREASFDKGLALRLDERRGVTWQMRPSGTAERSTPIGTSKEIEMCAACHSRRQQVSDPKLKSFFDAFRPALIVPGLYHVDGQQRDEVYTYGSFLQSRMNAAGVNCSDCHDPHSGKLRFEGNAVCGQCHDAARFDTASHHHHDQGAIGSRCVDCHMPTTDYMVVDPRHDHSMRIPRPDLTQSLGTPNACNGCHKDKSATWAAQTIKSWHPTPKPGFQTFATTFDLADRRAPGAQLALKRLLEDRSQPAIVRASALERLRSFPSAHSVSLAADALRDPAPIVRMAAIAALAIADANARLAYLPPLLKDPAAVVRMDAARALAGEPERQLPANVRADLDAALGEYEDAQDFNAERPESQFNIGLLRQQRGRLDEARSSFQRAIAVDPTFVPAFLALSELERAKGDEEAAERVLRNALARVPDSSAILHALGLSLVRQKRIDEALNHLRAAADKERHEARYAYTYVVALNDTGQRQQALSLLKTALTRHPYDRDLLATAVHYEFAAREISSALARADLLVELEPQSIEFARMRNALRRHAR